MTSHQKTHDKVKVKRGIEQAKDACASSLEAAPLAASVEQNTVQTVCSNV